MSNLTQITKDLIIFYIKENYKKYLDDNNIDKIEECNIKGIVDILFENKKGHMKEFLKKSTKELLKEEYPGDLTLNSLIREIYSDEELCKNRICIEIKIYQSNNED
jgi:hypothetical protein